MAVDTVNSRATCEKFDEAHWCNCHENFNLRVGISEGRTVLYRDVNNNYNVAGFAINSAARVMGCVDANQIAFTAPAYTQIIDMVDEPSLDEHFREYANVRIKHDERTSIYQYFDDEAVGLNSGEPELTKFLDLEVSMKSSRRLGSRSARSLTARTMLAVMQPMLKGLLAMAQSTGAKDSPSTEVAPPRPRKPPAVSPSTSLRDFASRSGCCCARSAERTIRCAFPRILTALERRVRVCCPV